MPLHTLPVTKLRRVGSNSYTAMLTAKVEMTTWTVPTLLLRFTEESGMCTLFAVTKGAMECFQCLEMNTIYTMTISGRCVTINDLGIKFGVKGQYQVKMQFAPKDLTKSKTAWPLQLNYQMTEFGDLQQADVGDFVDLSGRVKCKTTPTQTSGLAKTTVTLQCDDFVQDVQLLGKHATIEVKIGDMMTIKSAIVKKFQEEKFVETAFLSVIEVNPGKRKGIPDLPALADMDGERPRKAIKLELKPPVTTDWANTRLKKMVEDAQAGEQVDPMDFVLRCKIQLFDNEFFLNDAPFVGPEDGEKVKLTTIVSDDSGEMRVVIWTTAAIILFQLNKEQLRKTWEDGEMSEEDRPELLKKLNAHCDNFFLLSCTAKVWQNKVDVNVNNATDVSDSE